MASGLKGKLNAIAAQRAPSAAPARPAPELVVREYRQRADGRLFALSSQAMTRLGFAAPWQLSRALFLDTETTGLSGGAGTLAFLVGVGFVEGRELVVRQYLMPDYSAEAPLLHEVAQLLERYDTVVTFNGKSFDLPLLESRFTMMRMRDRWRALQQLDLLHPARRLWKLRLKNCTLSNLEACVLGCGREHDLPGSEVPQRYFDFLKSGDFRLLEEVLEHNHQDIVSLGTLLAELCAAYERPAQQLELADVFSLGRTLERQGEREEARRCYAVVGRPRPLQSVSALRNERLSGLANAALAAMYRREGNYEQAEALWRQMIARRLGGIHPYVELAKHLEHRVHDCQQALDVTERALALVSQMEDLPPLMRRKARLVEKLRRQRERAANDLK